MIQAEALTKVYGKARGAVTALQDVSVAMDAGVWGVVGPNGAGKTTLLGLVMGFLHPTSGTVKLDGRSPRAHIRRHGAAYLPERFRLPGAWPVRAALHALARLDGRPDEDAHERVEAALRRLGLQAYADRALGTLSRGLTQRVGLAQTLLADRRLVVLDEPTEGLDPLWRVRFRDLVDALRADDRTILLASHDLTEVERLADRVLVLDGGRIREVLDVRQPESGPLRYRLLTTAEPEHVQAAFPAATGEDSREAVGARSFLVVVADAAELSHRLAALLETGARVHAVIPLADDLETRVRQRLEER